MTLARLGLAAVLAATASCAAFNPYIRDASNPPSKGTANCTKPIDRKDERLKDEWLEYACGMAARIERARSQIVGSRSALTAALFPMGGIVAYNAARGFNAPTNTALTAAGISGYSAITTLAQQDRVSVYDAGLTSISCAIGKYGIALAVDGRESADRLVLRANVRGVRELIEAHKPLARADANLSQRLLLYSSIVDGVEQWLDESATSLTIGPVLHDFVLSTVATINEQLTATVPTNRDVADNALSIFQAQQPSVERASSLDRPLEEAKKASRSDQRGIAPEQDDELDLALTGLVALYKVAVTAGAASEPNLDLSSCKYKTVADVGVEASIEQLQLGPNNTYAGKTITIVRGATTFRTSVSGGIAPYTATVADANGPDKIDARISSEAGAAKLEITVPTMTGQKAGTYLIGVEDATQRYSRWITISVPAN